MEKLTLGKRTLRGIAITITDNV